MSDDSSNLARVPLPERPLPPWLIASTILSATVVLFFVAQLVGGFLISVYTVAQHWSAAQADDWLTNSVVAQFVYSLLADGLLVIGVALMLRWLRWQWDTIGLKRPQLQHLLIGLVATFPYYMLLYLIIFVLGRLVPSLDINQKQQIGFDSVHGTPALILTFCSLVIIPPLAEEITMRGFLYTGLKRWLPRVAAALVVSGLFGAAHLAEGGAAGPLWIVAIDTFTLSLVLVYLREKTGNLWAGIMLHAAKNCVAFFLLFIIGGR